MSKEDEETASGICSDRCEPPDHGELSIKGLSEELIFCYVRNKLKSEIEDIAKTNRTIGRLQVIGCIGNVAIIWIIFKLIFSYLN